MKINIIILVLLFSVGKSIAATPVVLFSDMTDGPVSGWEESATKGAAVTIWCRNVGSAVHTSYITVGGQTLYADESGVAEWGATTNPTVPLGMQRITFWLNSSMTTGGAYPNTTIALTTADGTSSIPFHCRTLGSNHIYFLDPVNGHDTNYDGLYASVGSGDDGPKLTPMWLRANMIAGDVAYLRSGTYKEYDTAYSPPALMHLISSNHAVGSEGMSITMTAYPTELVQLGEAKDLSHAYVAKAVISDGSKSVVGQPPRALKVSVAIIDLDIDDVGSGHYGYSANTDVLIEGTVGGSPDSETVNVSGTGCYETTKLFTAISAVTLSNSQYEKSGEDPIALNGDEYISVGYKETMYGFRRYASQVDYWTLSKMYWEVWDVCIEFNGLTGSDGSSHNRIIGNEMTTSMTNTSSAGSAITYHAGPLNADNVYVLGNYIHDLQADYRGEQTNRRIYAFYYGGYGDGENIYLGYNDMGYISSGRGWQFYGHTVNDDVTGVYIYNNWTHDTSRQVAAVSGGDPGTPYTYMGDCYIFNNIFSGAPLGDVVFQIAGSLSGGKYGGNFYVYNNVFFRGNAYPTLHIGADIDSVTLKNNIIIGYPNGWDYYTYYPDSVSTFTTNVTEVADHNIYYGCGVSTMPSWDDSTLDNDDPVFVDATPEDYDEFALQLGSPAIEAGSVNPGSGLFSGDFFSVVRGVLWDIGAVEYEAGAEAVSTTMQRATIKGGSIR